jgi:RNA polymerase sigma-70 factor (ECF subfamily)
VDVRDDCQTMEESTAATFDFESFFSVNYSRVAGIIARVVRDPARAEDLAVEVFWRLWRTPQAQGELAAGWVYRTAVRQGLDELRRRARRSRFESLIGAAQRSPTPEQLHAASQQQDQVRAVLTALDAGQAELLLLRASGFSYDELATALDFNPSSIGTLIARAQNAFRKEYVKRYGEP